MSEYTVFSWVVSIKRGLGLLFGADGAECYETADGVGMSIAGTYNQLCGLGVDAPNARDDQYVFASVLMLATKLQRHLDAALPELTLKQWLTLLLLYRLGGDAGSVTQIANLTGSSHQNTTKMIAALARDGWVERTTSTVDQRALRVTVTERTLAYFREHEAMGDRILAKLFADVPAADLAATARTLAAMQSNLEEGLL